MVRNAIHITDIRLEAKIPGLDLMVPWIPNPGIHFMSMPTLISAMTRLAEIRKELEEAATHAMREMKLLSIGLPTDDPTWDVLKISHDIADIARTDLRELNQKVIDGEI